MFPWHSELRALLGGFEQRLKVESDNGVSKVIVEGVRRIELKVGVVTVRVARGTFSEVDGLLVFVTLLLDPLHTVVKVVFEDVNHDRSVVQVQGKIVFLRVHELVTS